MELDFVCRCGHPLSQDDLKNSKDKCPYCGNFIPAVVWENYRLKKRGEPDMLDAIHDILADGKPLFSGAR